MFLLERLLLIHNQANHFHSAVLLAENQQILYLKFMKYLLIFKINRCTNEFIPIQVKSLLKEITQDNDLTSGYFKENIVNFYDNIVKY